MSCKILRAVVVWVVVTGCVGLLSPLAHGASHPGTDVIGLATEPNVDGEFSADEQLLGDFDLHLMVYGYEHAQGLAGWECRIVLPAGVQPRAVTLVGKPDPLGAEVGDFSLRVFPLIPLQPVGGLIHLATLHLSLLDADGVKEFKLAPHNDPQEAGKMSFALETSATPDLPLHWPGDCSECSVFEITPSAQPTVEATWDGVKSLYR